MNLYGNPYQQYLTQPQRKDARTHGLFNAANTLANMSAPQPAGQQPTILQMLTGGLQAYNSGQEDYAKNLAEFYKPGQKMADDRKIQAWGQEQGMGNLTADQIQDYAAKEAQIPQAARALAAEQEVKQQDPLYQARVDLLEQQAQSGGLGGSTTKWIYDTARQNGATHEEAFSAATKMANKGLVYNPSGGGVMPMPGYVPFIGQEAQAKAQGSAEGREFVDQRGRLSKMKAALMAEKVNTQNVANLIAKAMAQAGKRGATGIVAANTAEKSWGPGHQLYNTLTAIKAAIGFDKLQHMRSISEHGGALGSVSERELQYLQASIASLSQSQNEEQFKENLRAVQEHYNNFLAIQQMIYDEAVAKHGPNTGFISPQQAMGGDVPPINESELYLPLPKREAAPPPSPDVGSSGALMQGGKPFQYNGNPVSWADVDHTAKQHGLTRDEVLKRMGFNNAP